MRAKTRESILARLARLEAAASHLPRSHRLVPEQQAAFFQLLISEYGAPGLLLPSSRALFGAFAACASAFAAHGDANLQHPAVAALLPALRAELVSFLQEKLGTKAYWWERSWAWTDLACAGVRGARSDLRQRGPTAEEWCARLSDLETVFEAADCLLTSAMHVERWLECGDSRLRVVRESAQLPAEEAALLVAELGADTPQKRAAIAEAARERRFSGTPRELPA